ncbi:MAG: LytTR family DNA-binding domain-containing protein [Flavobacteriales bacterium]
MFKRLANQKIVGFNTIKRKLNYILAMIIFAALFLSLYQPFGISSESVVDSNHYPRLFVFVIAEIFAVFVGLTLSQLYFFRKTYVNPITIKEILKIFLIELLCITLLHNLIEFFIVNPYFPHEHIDQENEDWLMEDDFFSEVIVGFIFIIPQFFVLSFPFLGSLLFIQISNLNDGIVELENKLNDYIDKYQQEQDSDVLLDILDENNQIEKSINLNDILALESSNQYVLVYESKGDDIKKTLIRTRLKKVLSEMEHTPIQQCHRSYAVNLLNVKHLEQINRKNFLILSGLEELKIPVSKSYLQSIKQTIKSD